MAADRESTFVLKFDGDEGTLRSVLASLKSQIKSDVADLERVTSKVELFKDVAKNVTTAGAAVSAARAKVDELVASIASIKAASGQSVTGLEKEMKAAEKQLAATTRESDKQQASLAKLDAQLKAAGIDTSKLATEEARLAQALQAATTNATNQAAQQALGLRTLRDVTPELNRLRAAYNTLSVSGTLSVKELAIAQQQLQTRLAEVLASVTGAAGAAKAGGPDLVNFFKNSILPALGVTATIGTVVAGIKEAVAAAKEFQQGVAEIGTVTNLSKEELAGLGAGARQLATDLGVDVQAALKGVFDLIRSGVSPDNALEVLRVSAEAAKAALTDVGTGVKAANLLLDSFGADVSDLPILFDKIIKGAHDGGATLKEFAEAGGPLLNVARAAGASFDELLAVLTVLVDKSGDVGKSFSDLTKILARLQTSDVRAKLRDLNIEGTSIVDIFRQIGERGLTLADVLGVDLAGGGARSAASLATLTTNAKLVPEELERIAKAGGEAARNIRDLFDTPKERADRFDAAVKESSIQLGTLVGASSRVGVAVTGLLTAFNKLPAEFKEANLVGLNFTAIAAAMAVNMKDVAAESQRARDGVAKYGSASGDASDQVSRLADSQKRVRDEIEATARAANAAKAELGDFATRLTADVQALQAASARDIATSTHARKRRSRHLTAAASRRRRQRPRQRWQSI
jgi:TP901 family phage tail tape measure protein